MLQEMKFQFSRRIDLEISPVYAKQEEDLWGRGGIVIKIRGGGGKVSALLFSVYSRFSLSALQLSGWSLGRVQPSTVFFAFWLPQQPASADVDIRGLISGKQPLMIHNIKIRSFRRHKHPKENKYLSLIFY